MTRRRNPPPRNPARPLRSQKETKDQIDSELRSAKVTRKADTQQKQKMRRHEWDEDVEEANAEPEKFQYGDPGDSEEDDSGST